MPVKTGTYLRKPALPLLHKASRSTPNFEFNRRSSLPALEKPRTSIVRGISNARQDGENLATYVIKYYVPRDHRRKHEIKAGDSLKRTPPRDVPAAFVAKCQACSMFPNFSRASADEKLKAVKLDLLNEIQCALQNPAIAKLLGTDHLSALFRMISCNLIRRFPHVSFIVQPEIVTDNEYVHIGAIYNILSTLLSFQNFSKQQLASFLNQTFVSALFPNLYAPDPREQRNVVSVILEITHNFPGTVRPVFTKIRRFCLSIENDLVYPHAVAPVLQVLAGIFDEVVKTMKHVERFFSEMILPLHKLTNFQSFQGFLTRIVLSVLKLNTLLIREYVVYITRHWTVRSYAKCTALFEEVSYISDALCGRIDDESGTRLVKKISEFFSDPNGDVSQQSLFLMASNSMCEILGRCPARVLKIVYRRALKVNISHWLPDTRHFALDLMTELTDIDVTLKKMVMVTEEENAVTDEKRRNDVWRTITGMAPDDLHNSVRAWPRGCISWPLS